MRINAVNVFGFTSKQVYFKTKFYLFFFSLKNRMTVPKYNNVFEAAEILRLEIVNADLSCSTAVFL